MQANDPAGIEASERDERSTDLEITVCRDGRHANVRNSVSGSGDVHTVELAANGGVEGCTCPGWTYHHTCYHADCIQSNRLIQASVRALTSEPVATDGGRPQEETCDHCGGSEHGPGSLVDVSGDEWNDFSLLCSVCLLDVGGPGEAPEDTETVENAHGHRVPKRTERADFGGGSASGMDEL